MYFILSVAGHAVVFLDSADAVFNGRRRGLVFWSVLGAGRIIRSFAAGDFSEDKAFFRAREGVKSGVLVLKESDSRAHGSVCQQPGSVDARDISRFSFIDFEISLGIGIAVSNELREGFVSGIEERGIRRICQSRRRSHGRIFCFLQYWSA